MEDQKPVAVGIGGLHVTKDSSSILVAYGLGSCIGVSAYDPVAKVGGLAHVMLPNSKEAARQPTSNKFADVAVPTLIRELVKLGAAQSRLVCRIAGGAQMLNAPGHLNGFKIGERNIEAVLQALQQYKITPRASHTGGSQGRTMRFFIDTGRVFVRTAGQEEVEL
ncbi:MAG: chemotaxis protein CheD [Chloroflexi bacterium]|nr:chemotaxis protein CheD [Chloroflexota bacterium]